MIQDTYRLQIKPHSPFHVLMKGQHWRAKVTRHGAPGGHQERQAANMVQVGVRYEHVFMIHCSLHTACQAFLLLLSPSGRCRATGL